MKLYLLLFPFVVLFISPSDKPHSILPSRHHKHHHHDIEAGVPMIVINTSSSEEFNRDEDRPRSTLRSTPWYCSEKMKITVISTTASLLTAAITAGITLAAMSNDCRK